jgi:hypothetical protein
MRAARVKVRVRFVPGGPNEGRKGEAQGELGGSAR